MASAVPYKWPQHFLPHHFQLIIHTTVPPLDTTQPIYFSIINNLTFSSVTEKFCSFETLKSHSIFKPWVSLLIQYKEVTKHNKFYTCT